MSYNYVDCKDRLAICTTHHAEACIEVGVTRTILENAIADSSSVDLIVRKVDDYLMAKESQKNAKLHLDEAIKNYGRYTGEHGYNAAMQIYKK